MRPNEIFTAEPVIVKIAGAALRRTFSRGVCMLLASAAVCSLSACANFGNVVAEDNEGGYSLTATAISYTMSMAELTSSSRAKASAYCADQDKNMQLRQQARGWRPMQVELSFRCLPKQLGGLEQPASLSTFK